MTRKEAPSKTRYDNENSVMVGMRLMKKGDADIIGAIQGKKKQTELKRLIRIGLKHDEKNILEKSEKRLDNV